MTTYNAEIQSWPPPHSLTLVTANLRKRADLLAKVANPARAGIRANLATAVTVSALKQDVQDIRDALARSQCRWSGHGTRDLDPKAAKVIRAGTSVALTITLELGRIGKGFATRVAASEALTKLSAMLDEVSDALDGLDRPVEDSKPEPRDPAEDASTF